MRFMLLQNYGEVESGCEPMSEWAPGEVQAHIDFQVALNQVLAERGELVDAQGLAGPDEAKFVVATDVTAPVITDGPYPESKELLAGYRIIEVGSLDRALEIAAEASAAPGPRGEPMGVPMEVRQIIGAPEPAA
ncbi:MAG: YciI family protein [Acidimicrobiales bacterium]